jgi:hypothetical protein
MAVACINIDSGNIADKIFKFFHFFKFSIIETEQVVVDNLVVPARNQSVPGISDEGEFEVVVKMAHGIVQLSAMFNIQMHAIVQQVIQDGGAADLCYAEPDEFFS